MATLKFEAFGQRFRTQSTAEYILVRGPFSYQSRIDGQTYAYEAAVVGYAYSLKAAIQRRRRENGLAEVKIISLSTGKEVKL
jgi:hypothetical protein